MRKQEKKLYVTIEREDGDEEVEIPSRYEDKLRNRLDAEDLPPGSCSTCHRSGELNGNTCPQCCGSGVCG